MRRLRPLGRARGRARLLTLTVVGIALFAACVPLPPPPPPPPVPPYQTQYCAGGSPVRAADYQAQHDGIRTVNTDFGAGDGGAPFALPDGRILWMFADTWVGYIRNEAMVAPYHYAHNAFVVQSGGCLTPVLGGTHGARTDLIPGPAGSGQYYWPMGAFVDGGTLQVFVMRFAPGTGICGCVALDVGIAKFALPSLQYLGTDPSPASGLLPEFGSGVMTADGFHYFVGRNSPDAQHPRQQYLARVPVGTDAATPGSWRDWNGGTTGTDLDWGLLDASTACVVDPGTGIGSGGACPMQFEMPSGIDPGVDVPTSEGPNAGLWIVPQADGTFLASAKLHDVYPEPINTWTSATPFGPWVGRRFAASTPSPAGTFTYSGRVFQLPGGEPTAQYSFAGPHTDQHTDTYRVIFSTPAP